MCRYFLLHQRFRVVAHRLLLVISTATILRIWQQTPNNNVRVLLGIGDGTFSAPQDFAAGTGARSVVMDDFNGDGNADLATSNGGFNGANSVSVLLGNGDGTFQEQQTFTVGDRPESVTTGDFNDDRKSRPGCSKPGQR